MLLRNGTPHRRIELRKIRDVKISASKPISRGLRKKPIVTMSTDFAQRKEDLHKMYEGFKHNFPEVPLNQISKVLLGLWVMRVLGFYFDLG